MSVESILLAMAQNAGRAKLATGQAYADVVGGISQAPAQYYAGRDEQQARALRQQQIQQQIALEQARGEREKSLAERNAQLDKKNQDALDAQGMKERALKNAIGAGFEDDPKAFNLPKAVDRLKQDDALDLAPTLAAVHDKFSAVQKPFVLKPGETAFDEQTRQPIPGMSAPEKAPSITNEWEAYMQTVAPGQVGVKSWADMTPEQRGKALSTFNALKADPAAARQANALAAQIAQQGRAQSFQEAQAGRRELTEKVEQPYRQAQQSAQELRDLVHAAQSGNKEAASLQALQATMSTVRANGLNRLNQAEMNLPANAGSLWDRIQNEAGKLTAGQPINADLQKDLLAYADLIDKGAYNRYKNSHGDITTRYKLTEKPLPPPDAGGTPAPAKGGGLSYQDYLNSKKKK